MATDDQCVTIQPYFVVKEGELEKATAYLEKFVKQTRPEKGCLYYGFSRDGNQLHCREGYANAVAALAHLKNIGPLLKEALASGLIELTELQVHGPEEELAIMREPLADLNPTYWVLEHGFRN